MNEEKLELKLASYEYFESFFRLRSQPKNIYWSGFSEAPIKEKLEHHFFAAIESSSREFYLLCEKGEAIGYLYIDYNSDTDEVEIAYGISSEKSGRGLAKFMIKEGLSATKYKVDKVIAWIATSNIPSIKSVESLGFIKTVEEEVRSFNQEVEPVKFCKFIKIYGDCQ
ncbi:GNAT family N-acetyltransferase [Vibrio campbellii]|uniref:GNAT family N-acetyltransferase n=1 Tax=Vibrio campbellii TaxID=680 RepID=UPI0038CD17C4